MLEHALRHQVGARDPASSPATCGHEHQDALSAIALTAGRAVHLEPPSGATSRESCNESSAVTARSARSQQHRPAHLGVLGAVSASGAAGGRGPDSPNSGHVGDAGLEDLDRLAVMLPARPPLQR